MPYDSESPRLYLERFTQETCRIHQSDFHELWISPEATQWSTMPPKAELSESKGLLDDMWKKMREDPALDKYFIVLKGENKVIGIIGTNRWSEQGMEMGYCVNIHYWGKGYATEALKAFLDLFWSLPDRKEIPRLVAKIHPDNISSRKVLVKAGAREGEVIKDAYARFVDQGRKSDDYCWYLDRPTSRFGASPRMV